MKAIQKFSFEKFLDCPASWLSAGEKRRLSLIRLSFCPAKVWILDEPSTYLDKDNREILISITFGSGPMNLNPDSLHFSAKAAFSAKKP